MSILTKSRSDVRPIFDYNSFIDTDMSIYDLLKREFADSKYFIDGVFEDDPIIVKYLFLNRPLANPLSALLKVDYLGSANKLYDDLIDNYAKDIFGNIYYTDVFKLFSNLMLIETDGYHVGCIIDHPLKEEVLEHVIAGAKRPLRIHRGYENTELDECDSLYLKYADSLHRLPKKPVKKHIFICEYNFNVVYLDSGRPGVRYEYHEEFPNNLFYVSHPYAKLPDIERE